MRTAMTLLLLAALAAPAARGDDERRPSGVYVPDPGPEAPALAGAVTAQAVAVPVEPAALDAARAERAARIEALAARAQAAPDEAAREALEEEIARLKREGESADLRTRLAAAEAGGFAEQAARLAQALRELEAPRAPVAPGATAPRDPATGAALDGAKGGAR